MLSQIGENLAEVDTMNLSQYPTKEQLRGLIASCDDEDGDHVLWVDHNGRVHLSLTPEELNGEDLNDAVLIKFRFDVWLKGQGDVGPLAAEDEAWIEEQFENLRWAWNEKVAGVIDFPMRRLS